MRGAVTTPGLSTRDYKRNVAPASARPLDYYNPRTHAAQASHGGSAVVAGRAKILNGGDWASGALGEIFQIYHRCCHGRLISVSSSESRRAKPLSSLGAETMISTGRWTDRTDLLVHPSQSRFSGRTSIRQGVIGLELLPPVLECGRDGLSRYAKFGKCRDFNHLPTPACNYCIVLVYHARCVLGRNWVEISAGERPERQNAAK